MTSENADLDEIIQVPCRGCALDKNLNCAYRDSFPQCSEHLRGPQGCVETCAIFVRKLDYLNWKMTQ